MIGLKPPGWQAPIPQTDLTTALAELSNFPFGHPGRLSRYRILFFGEDPLEGYDGVSLFAGEVSVEIDITDLTKTELDPAGQNVNPRYNFYGYTLTDHVKQDDGSMEWVENWHGTIMHGSDEPITIVHPRSKAKTSRSGPDIESLVKFVLTEAGFRGHKSEDKPKSSKLDNVPAETVAAVKGLGLSEDQTIVALNAIARLIRKGQKNLSEDDKSEDQIESERASA